MGSRWRIGDDEATSVSHDRWIPLPPNFMLSNAPLIPVEMLVFELKDYTGAWNIPLIEAMFSPKDVEAILSTLESRGGGPDKLRWHFTKDGEYSVRIGYQVAMEVNCAVGPSSPSGNLEWWNKL